MKLLGLDFETTGLDNQNDRVIEIGAVVWDTEKNKPLALMSELIKPDNHSKLSEEIIKITGIDDSMLNDYGIEGKIGFERLVTLINDCDHVMAHNANFDRAFFEKEIKHYGVNCKEINWIDSCIDVPYPESITTRKLTYLAAEHGIVNTYAHRAVFDVLTMLNLVKNYDYKIILERAASPKISAIAKVTYDEREKAKNMGFHWNREKKVWFKEMKECDLKNTQFPFEIIVNAPSL